MAEPVADPERVLSLRLSESAFKPRTQRGLERNFRGRYTTATLEDLVAKRAADLSLGSIPLINALDFLEQFNLRLGLSAPEIDFYRRNGTLEPVSEESSIAVMCLSREAEAAILQIGIERVKDFRLTSLRALLRQPDLGELRVREIRRAAERLGFRVYQTEAEQRCEEGLAPHPRPWARPFGK